MYPDWYWNRFCKRCNGDDNIVLGYTREESGCCMLCEHGLDKYEYEYDSDYYDYVNDYDDGPDYYDSDSDFGYQ